MACMVCDGVTHDWFGDTWCDACGGVLVPRPDKDPLLIFRHVATVDGAGGRLPVVWDESSRHYLFRWPNKVNPRYAERNTERVDDIDFGPTPVLSSFGILDAVLVQALNAARGPEGGDLPTVSVAPSSTPEERALLGV